MTAWRPRPGFNPLNPANFSPLRENKSMPEVFKPAGETSPGYWLHETEIVVAESLPS
jgi:hypothetical protein